MPIIGIVASSITGGLVTDTGAMFPIAVANVGSAGATFIEFTGIPQTYKHLQFRSVLRNTAADSAGQAFYRVNGVTSGSSYSWHGFYGTGSSAGVENSAVAATDGMYGQLRYPGGTATANVFGVGVCDILDYSSTTKAKTFRTFGGYDPSGTGSLREYSGVLLGTTEAITSIRITDQSGSGFAQYSQIALYGIKGETA